jgi:hypothetical protein
VALMLGSLREALIAAGAPEDKAVKAAEEVAGYENRLASVDVRMERLEGRVSLLQWMVAFNIALSVVILGRVFV